MAKVKDEGNGTFSFFCPGCGEIHSYYVVNPHPNGAQWSFNGDLNNPTFTPSLLLRWGKEADPNWQEPTEAEEEFRKENVPDYKWSGRCHLFVTNGLINYCGDCTHDLAGKTGVEMKDI